MKTLFLILMYFPQTYAFIWAFLKVCSIMKDWWFSKNVRAPRRWINRILDIKWVSMRIEIIADRELSISLKASAFNILIIWFHLISNESRFAGILSDAWVRRWGRLCTRSRGRRRWIRWWTYDYNGFNESGGVEILSVDERSHGFENGCRYHFPCKAGGRQNMSCHLISLRNNGHWRDNWRQTW